MKIEIEARDAMCMARDIGSLLFDEANRAYVIESLPPSDDELTAEWVTACYEDILNMKRLINAYLVLSDALFPVAAIEQKKGIKADKKGGEA